MHIVGQEAFPTIKPLAPFLYLFLFCRLRFQKNWEAQISNCDWFPRRKTESYLKRRIKQLQVLDLKVQNVSLFFGDISIECSAFETKFWYFYC